MLVKKDGTKVPFKGEIPKDFSGEIQGFGGNSYEETLESAIQISTVTKRLVWFKHNDILIRVKVGSKKMSS